MTPKEEEAFELGQQMMAVTLMTMFMTQDFYKRLPDGERKAVWHIRELANVRFKVRELCEYLGVEYGDERALPDILEDCINVAEDWRNRVKRFELRMSPQNNSEG